MGQSITRGERRRGLLFLAPLVVFCLLLWGYPAGADLYYSFTSLMFRSLRAPQWVGLANFVAVLKDPNFWGALGFSARFAVTATVFEILLGLGLALALQPLLSDHKPLLAPLLLPLMVAPVLLGIMYRLLLNDFVGMISQYLKLLGIQADLLSPPWIVPTVIGIEVFQWTPFAFLIFFTALESIPRELLEAAQIDGASGMQATRRIKLPLLVSALAIASFVRFVDSFRVFDHIYVLTGGGPGTLTTSITIYIYRTFFQQQLLGQAIATALLLLVLSLIPLSVSMRYILRDPRR